MADIALCGFLHGAQQTVRNTTGYAFPILIDLISRTSTRTRRTYNLHIHFLHTLSLRKLINPIPRSTDITLIDIINRTQ